MPNSTTSATIGAGTFTPSTNGVVGASCLNLTIQAAGDLDLPAGFPLAVHGTASSSKLPTGADYVRCVGTGTASGTWRNLEFAATYTFSSGSVAGDLLQTAGNLTIGGFTIPVAGNATFQGSTLLFTAGGGSQLDIAGNVVFATTSNVTMTNSAGFFCAGNWTANSFFAPTAGTVTFDGVVPQTASPAVANGNLNWFGLTIAAGANLQPATTGTAIVGGTLLVNGVLSLSTFGASLQVNGFANFANGGTTLFGTGVVHTFGGNVTISASHGLGTGAGLTMRLAGSGTLSTSLALDFDVEVTGSYTLSSCTIQQDLVHTASATGNLVIGSSQTVVVNGNASILGPSLTSPGNGTLNVRGNVVFDTLNNVTLTTPGTLAIRCGGNWTASTRFAPTTSTVTFDGGITQVLAPTLAGGNLTFFGFTLSSGTTAQVATSGTLSIGSTATISGALSLATGGASLLAAAQVNLQSTGSTNFGTGLLHQFQGSINIQAGHGLSGGAGVTLRLAGTGNLTTSVAIPFDVDVTGSYTLNAATLQQNLTYSSASANLVIGGSATVTVNGNASFTGQSVTCPAAGSTLNVRGNVLFDTTSNVTLTSPGTLAIRCGGNWTANTRFAPTTSLVTFDGTPPQIASPVVPGAQLNWFDLTVATNSNVQLASSGTANIARLLTVSASSSLNSATLSLLQVASTATINGVLSLATAQLAVNGQCNMNAGGSTTLGPGQTHLFGNNLTVTHAFNAGTGSLVRLQGAGTLATSGAGSVRDVDVTGSYSMAGSTILGNLTYASTAAGPLLFQNNTVLVNGNATFDGPSVNGGSVTTGTLNVRGNLTFNTLNPTTLSTAVNIQVGGTWTASSTFTPGTGSVTFNGSSPQTAQSSGVGGTLSFFDLIVVTGSNLQIGTATTLAVGRLLTVQASASLTSTSVTLTTVGLTCTVGGTMNLSSTELRVTGQCNLQSGGSTTLGAGKVHLFSNNLNVGHVLNAGLGSIARLQGTGVANSGGGGATLPPLEVTGSYQFGNPSVVQGDFVQTATGTVVIQNTVTLLVQGNALFQGPAISGTAATLNVRGNLTLHPTTSFTQALGPTTMRCGGNWDSNANYQPTAGVVIFDGTGTQTVTATSLLMRTVNVNSASNLVFVVANLTVSQDLVVDGSFTTPSVSTDVQGDLTVNATGTVTVGSGTHTVQGDLTVNGTTAGAGELVMDGTGTLSGTGTVTKLRVQTGGTVTSDNATVSEFTLSTGVVNITASRTLHVLADATFLGGTLGGGAGSVLDVDGDVDFNGTLPGATTPVVRAGGSYSSNQPFRPGQVIFDTNNLHVVNSNPPAAPVRIDDIQVQGGTLRLGNSNGLEVLTITIAAGAIFEVPAGAFTLTSVAVTVNGEFRVLAGADLALGNNSVITAAVGGTLSLLGVSGARAIVRSSSSTSWRANVNGTLRGREFELRDLSPYRSPADRGGVRLLAGAQVAAPPFDFSDGILAGASTDANGALLWLANGASKDFYDLTLLDTGVIPFRNAATAAAAPVAYRFFRYDGNLGGVSFEDDPNGVVSWLDAGRTALASSSAVSGVQRVDVAFATSQEVDTTGFELWRRSVPGGPATLIASLSAAGSPTSGASYTFGDVPLLDSSRYYYEIDDVRPGRPVRRLGEVSGRPWQAQSGNAFFVGNGGFADVATALATAPDGATIVLGAGTHAAFTLDRPMRVVGAEAGQVLIDTTAAPMVVRDQFVFEGDVVLYDLTIGSATSPFGLELVNCDNVIVLDGVEAHAQATGLLVDDCPRVALQDVLCRGTTALSIQNGSTVFLTRGDVPTMQVANFSQVQHTGLLLGTGTPDGTSTILGLPGVSPRVEFPLLWSGLQTYEATVDTAPGDFYALYLAPGRFFFDFSPFVTVDGVALVDPGTATVLASGLVGPTGVASLQFLCPEFTYAWGGAVSVQVLSLRLAAARPFVLGNVRDIVFVP